MREQCRERAARAAGDNLRPEGREDPEGVAEACRTLDTAYPVLDAQLPRNAWPADIDAV